MMTEASPRRAILALIACVPIAHTAHAQTPLPFQPAVSVETVARSFFPTPAGDAAFLAFSDAQFFDGGRVVFSASTTAGSAVYRWTPGTPGTTGSPGTLEELLTTGLSAPGAPGDTFDVLTGFNRLVANQTGDLALRAFLDLDGPADILTDGGLWASGAGVYRLPLREGQALPNDPDAHIFIIEDQLLSGAGRTAARVRLTGKAVDATNDFAILRETMPGVIEAVAREGSPCPAIPGSQYTVLGMPALGTPCDVVFDARITGTGVNATNDRALIVEGSFGPRLVARAGDTSPDGFGAFATFAQPAINDAGAVAALCTLTGPGVNSTNDRAILTEASGALGLLLREGDPAPGLPGLTVSAIDNFDLALDGAGATPVLGRISGPGVDTDNDAVLWFGVPGDLRVVAREGFYPPQFQGVQIGPFGVAQSIGHNADLFFVGTLTGDNVNSSNNDALWSYTSGGELVLLLREGSPIDLSGIPGQPDLRTPTSFTPFGVNTGGEEGRANYAGARECVTVVNFTDGTSAVVVVRIEFPGSEVPGCSADFDQDGDVDLTDFSAFGSQFGNTDCDENR